MLPSKLPGLDGFNAGFYQRYWEIVGRSVTETCLSILNGNKSMRDINHTLVVLILKIEHAVNMGDFRPISLCNVIYKIISKVLTNRLRGVLGELVSETQSAFIPGRSIFDNAIVGFECMHALKRKRKGKVGLLGLKLDMAKAYDRVEWWFLRAMLLTLGFPPAWVRIIMECVLTVKYSFLINGESFGLVQPTRDLRQGDPLSPYLFLLCAEGLSSLICSAKRCGLFSGLRCSRSGPKIIHLFFADDSMIFTSATLEECLVLKDVLWKYERATGQKVNFHKSAICFSGRVSQGLILKRNIFALLCVVLWRVWFRRNKAVHGQLLLPAGDVADALVKAALSLGFNRFWSETCPPLVELLVQEDSPG
ncbi:hypothetical protein ACOSP7_007582 [Xanthoceras sorbifolium]